MIGRRIGQYLYAHDIGGEVPPLTAVVHGQSWLPAGGALAAYNGIKKRRFASDICDFALS